MSKCFIYNIYIYIYIYVCLFNFVVNEDKYYLRFDGEPKMKWEFKLDLNTEGGLNLSNQLKNQKELENVFSVNGDLIYCIFPLLNEQSSTEAVETKSGYIIVCEHDTLNFVYKDDSTPYNGCQKIGHLINKEDFSEEKLNGLPFDFNDENQDLEINLVLAYERTTEEPKIAEINKKIILIIIIGLSLLIILLITKFIVK